jgi:hypothetical protein
VAHSGRKRGRVLHHARSERLPGPKERSPEQQPTCSNPSDTTRSDRSGRQGDEAGSGLVAPDQISEDQRHDLMQRDVTGCCSTRRELFPAVGNSSRQWVLPLQIIVARGLPRDGRGATCRGGRIVPAEVAGLSRRSLPRHSPKLSPYRTRRGVRQLQCGSDKIVPISTRAFIKGCRYPACRHCFHRFPSRGAEEQGALFWWIRKWQ